MLIRKGAFIRINTVPKFVVFKNGYLLKSVINVFAISYPWGHIGSSDSAGQSSPNSKLFHLNGNLEPKMNCYVRRTDEESIKDNFHQFSIKTYVVGTH